MTPRVDRCPGGYLPNLSRIRLYRPITRKPPCPGDVEDGFSSPQFGIPPKSVHLTLRFKVALKVCQKHELITFVKKTVDQGDVP